KPPATALRTATSARRDGLTTPQRAETQRKAVSGVRWNPKRSPTVNIRRYRTIPGALVEARSSALSADHVRIPRCAKLPRRPRYRKTNGEKSNGSLLKPFPFDDTDCRPRMGLNCGARWEKTMTHDHKRLAI